MGDEYHSLELQELRKITALLERIYILKEEQARKEWRSAEPPTALAGSHDCDAVHERDYLIKQLGCEMCHGPYSKETILGWFDFCRADGHLPPKADTAEGAKATEAVRSSNLSSESEGLWCPRCRTRLYHGKAHIHTPNREA